MALPRTDGMRSLRLWIVPHRISERAGWASSTFEEVAKYVTPELACIVEIERYRAKVGGSEAISPVTLRVTSIFRPEDGTWKIVHRHADPITTPQPAESVIQE